MLKEVRESKGLSQAALAEKSGVSKKAICSYEQGWRNIRMASYDTLEKIANALETEIKDIVNQFVLLSPG